MLIGLISFVYMVIRIQDEKAVLAYSLLNYISPKSWSLNPKPEFQNPRASVLLTAPTPKLETRPESLSGPPNLLEFRV